MRKEIIRLFAAFLIFLAPLLAQAQVGTWGDLQTAAGVKGSGNIKLSANISGTAQLTIARSLTLDLNGHKLTITLDAPTGVISNGIKITSGVTLTLMDSSSPSTGVLAVTNNADFDNWTPAHNRGAAINTSEGALIINSGTVHAYGGYNGAGIGGGTYGGGGTIIINGGTVMAFSNSYGAGIGGGHEGDGGTITISGGAITATSNRDGGAGIGGGRLGAGGTIIINGGTVTATSGDLGAGIGGGVRGTSGTIEISGTASVIAVGGKGGGAGIGSGGTGEKTSVAVDSISIATSGAVSAFGGAAYTYIDMYTIGAGADIGHGGYNGGNGAAVLFRTPSQTAPPPTTITSPSSVTVAGGIESKFQVTASGHTPLTYSKSSGSQLPAGVTINSTTGVMTIAATTAVGEYSFWIVASNRIYPQDFQLFTLTVQTSQSSSSPAITSADSTTATSGRSSVFQVTTTGGEQPISYSLLGQPAGVTINSATGVMSVAATTAVGTHSFTIMATDSASSSTTMNFTLLISAAENYTQNAYIAFFNRPADVPGMDYWVSYPGNMQDLLTEFSQSAEYLSDYAGLSNQEVITKVYKNLFGRAPDTEGLTYWTTQMNAGHVSIANAAYAIMGGARNEDAQIIANKARATNIFTKALNSPQKVEAYNNAGPMGLGDAAKNWLAEVDWNIASVNAAEAKLPALINELVEKWNEFAR